MAREYSVEDIIGILKKRGSRDNAVGMERYGIRSKALILGVPKPVIKRIAREIGVDHRLAIELWNTGVHKARILATLIADPCSMDDELLEKWLSDVDNWDLCDQLVLNLLWRIDNAYEKAIEWCKRREEFVKRTGYALLARLVWRRVIGCREIEGIKGLIIEGAMDSRPYVYKAVSWLLKWLAKRDDTREVAIEIVGELEKLGTRGSKYIVRDVKKYLKT